MKPSILLTAAIAALTLLGTTPSSEARPSHRHPSSNPVYISGYQPCGTPIYTERYLIRYDRCGYPVWGYRAVPPPRRFCPPPHTPYRRPAACPPPYPDYRSQRPRGGVVISGVFRL